jgi:hypothetical protein
MVVVGGTVSRAGVEASLDAAAGFVVEAAADAGPDAAGDAVGPPDPQPAMMTTAKLATSRRRSMLDTSEAGLVEAHRRFRPA